MYELTTGAQTTPFRPTEPPGNNDWTSLFTTIARRRGAFGAIFGSFFLLVLLLSLLTPKSYTTDVKMIAGPSAAADPTSQSNETDLPILNALRFDNGMQSAETYATLLVQPDIAQSVISDLHLNVPVDKLIGAINVKPITNTSILDVSVTWRNPGTAAQIANHIADVFVQHERNLVISSANSALDFVNAQLPDAARRMHDSETKLAQYEASHHIADITSQTQNTITSISALDAKIASTEVDQRQNEAELANVRGQLAATSATTGSGGSIGPNPVYAQLQSQLSSVSVQLQTARQQYTDKFPAVIALVQQQNQLRSELSRTPPTIVASTTTTSNPVYTSLNQQVATTQAAIASDTAQISTMRAQRAALEPALQSLPGQTNQLAELRSQATSSEDVFNALQKKANEATVSRASALSDVTIVSPADPGVFIQKPNLKVNLIIGLVLGLALAVSGVLLIDFFDNSIKDEADIVALSLPVLATVPRLEAKGKLSLPWVRSLTIESFLQLVTSLRYASDKPISTLAITSPLQGDGKSTIAMNTAIALSEVSPRILLIDADLRRPSLHTKFEIRNEAGLSDVLVGNAQLQNVIRSTRHAGLDVVTSGTRTPNPYRLLQSERFDRFLEDALQVYRTVIIDGPALNPIIDGAVICKKADATVMVVSSGSTDVRSTKKALQRLQSVGVRDILGIVVNRTVPKRSDYDDYYLGAGTPSLSLPSEV